MALGTKEDISAACGGGGGAQFFQLQTPDFAWKFVWTVPTNYIK